MQKVIRVKKGRKKKKKNLVLNKSILTLNDSIFNSHAKKKKKDKKEVEQTEGKRVSKIRTIYEKTLPKT